MGVDHGGSYIAVAEQFLHGADVRASLQQVGGERVSEGVAAHRLGHPRGHHGPPNLFLNDRAIQVVAPLLPTGLVSPSLALREDPLPGPLPVGVGVLAREGVGSTTRPQPVGLASTNRAVGPFSQRWAGFSASY